MKKQKLIVLIILLAAVLAGCVTLAMHLTASGSQADPTVPSETNGLTDPTETDAVPTETDPISTETDPKPTETDPVPTETEPIPTETDPIPTETTPVPTEPEDGKIHYTLTFVGDCTLGTMPDRMAKKSSYLGVIGDNYTLPFQYVYQYFSTDDCTFANLEGVFIDGEATAADKQFTFRGPTAYTNILTMGSVEVVSLANNHPRDFGDEGYHSTKNALKGAGVTFVERNNTALYTTESGLTIGVYAVYGSLSATDMKKDVAMLRQQGAEIIVASMHLGTEGSYHENEKQISIAHTLIDGGVDIVWGHHPHVLQKIEEYNGGIIYYSLGNFSFGGNHSPYDYDSVVLQQEIVRDEEGNVTLGKTKLIPCSISAKKKGNNFQPKPYDPDSEEYARALAKLSGTYLGPDVDMSYRDELNKPKDPTTPTTPTEPAAPAS